MSVLIKGMKKPRDKDVILRIDSKGEVYIYGGYPTEIHEAVELPDHGDLIDRDVLIKNLRDYACKSCKEYGADKNGDRCAWCSFDDAFARIEKAKAVIPAEGSEE